MSQVRSWTMALAWSALAATVIAAQSSPVQQPATATRPSALILGRCVDAVTGAPIGGAVVTINTTQPPAGSITPITPPTSLGRFPVRVLADAGGHFVFRELPKGSYGLIASKPGYTDTSYGRRSAGDTSTHALILSDGERQGDVTIPFWKAGSISGTVADESGEPAIGVQVRAFRRAIVGGHPRYSGFGAGGTTDDRGAYRIASLPPGDYLVGIVTTQTTVPSSLATAYTAANTAGTSSQFQREMDRSGGIFGISVFSAGQRVGSWQLQSSLGSRGVTTPPVNHGKVFVYPTTYYPGATSTAQASVVSLEPGAERGGIDLQLRPVAASQISGILTGLQGPESFTMLSLVSVFADEMQNDNDALTASTLSDTSGAFTFLGVPPGRYVIRVLKIPPRPIQPLSSTTVIQTGSSMIMSSSGPSIPPPIPDDPTLSASVPVTVEDGDVTGVSVSLAPGARLSGHLEFDGMAEQPTATQLRLIAVTIDPADARTASLNQFTLNRGVVDANGQFKTYQLAPGQYVVRASGNWPGWTFKGATLDGHDISDSPLDLSGKDLTDIVVTFTDHPSELAGVVRDTKGPVAGATVIVFPRQPARWIDQGPSPRRIRAARVSSDGSYRFVNLPADDYLLVAIDAALPSDWQDPKYLQKAMALASPINIADHEKRSLDLEPRQVR